MSEEVRVARRRRPGEVDTAARILTVAERLVQHRGFNGFSYADVAAALDITKASLHYHFAGKAQLGEALIARYAARFAESLAAIDSPAADAPAKLHAYASLYADALRGDRMCLCGMLAAEYSTLPKPMRDAVIRFFDDNEAWLTKVLEQGEEEGTLQFTGSASDAARMIVGGLEGAMLVARPYGDLARFEAAARRLLASLLATTREPVASGTGARLPSFGSERD
jgi:TetR/AcrR family transcriptional repressor of nem operon